ncbi:GntR family transcriptional regulator [Schumannella luteola]
MLRVQSVAQELERRVVDGVYAEGTRLPAEPELATEFAVSRTTIRGAVADLQARGLVSREQGRGTFVRGTGRVSVSMTLETNLSVSAVIRESGRQPGTTGLSVHRELAPAAVLAALRLPAGSHCIVVRRTRTADGVAVTDSIDHLLEVPSLPTDPGSYEQSVYELLEEVHRRPVSSGTAMIQAATAEQPTAERLGVAVGHPILVLSQVHDLDGGIPVMYSIVSIRSDVMNLYVHRGSSTVDPLHESTARQPSDQDAPQSSPVPAVSPGIQ